jgi:uncharacterized protein (DUF2236 family)
MRPSPCAAPAEELAADHAAHARCVAWVTARVDDPVAGLFGPDSVAWTMIREPAYLFGGAAAVLLQMALPSVVAGVSAYSTFETDLVGRIQRTSQALYNLVFGTLDVALGTSRRMHAIHTQVRGAVDEPGSAHHGRPYRANDQALLSWVSLTASLTGRAAFEAFVRPLTADELARDWEDLQRGSIVAGVDPATLPASRAALVARFDDLVENSSDLWVGPKARTVARVLFSTPLSRGIFDPITTAALLPPRLRALYALPWGASEQRAYDRRRRAFAALRRAAPPAVRYVPAYHQALRRVALHRGQPGSRWGQLVDLASARFALPASLRPARPA